MDDTIIIYDVKYTLTSGKGKIRARRGVRSGDQWVRLNTPYYDMRNVGKDCALAPQVAMELAAKLRDRKVHNLKKQIARLEALEFLIVDESNA